MKTVLGGAEIIPLCARLIQEGEVVGFPTETVYGLGADALNEEAVRKIYLAKGRPSDNPLIVHVPNVEEARKAAEVSPLAEKLFSVFSPGPLTIVLPKKDKIPYTVTAGLDTVGIRIPSHPIARAFLEACKTPVAAPSANLSKRVSPTTADAVFDDMNGRVPAIIDGGPCSVGIESTVLSLVGDPTILRPGGITEEMLRPYLPTVKLFSGKVKVAPAPGMKYKHYAPIVPCILYGSVRGAEREYVEWTGMGKKAVILSRKKNVPYWEEKGFSYMNVGDSGEEFASNIFRLLRYCEKLFDVILVEKPGSGGIENSLMDRLAKSCGGKTVE